MKHIEEYLKDVIKVEPLGKLTTMDDELYGMSGEMVYIDGKCSGIFISHADYVNWLEKQDEYNPKFRIGETINKFRIGDTIKKESTGDIVAISDIDLKNREYRLSNTGFIPFKYEYLWELVEQKPVNKVESKFKVGDWVTFTRKDGTREVLQVSNIIDGRYYFNKLLHGSWSVKECNEKCHLWTIQDAKPGDVLAAHECIVLFKEIDGLNIKCHCTYHFMNNPSFYVNTLQNKSAFHPATKEQSDLLFQKMKESGYKWENNQLSQLEGINDEGFVDLGLPSGTLWAKCNLGAKTETEFGYFFQWGETEKYKGLKQFNWNDYKFGSWKNLTKYNNTDDKLVLDNDDDPVYVATDGKMKTPTKEQLQELMDYTNHGWIENFKGSGVNGIKFWKKGTEEPTDSNSYIFIPAAGYCYSGSHNDVGSWGNVWSASRNESGADIAWDMYFNAGYVDMYYSSRCLGFSVRGVVAKNI